MSHPDEDDPLSEIVEQAEQQREQFIEARSQLQAVRERLREMVTDLEEEGTLGADEGDTIRGLIEDGEYERARQAITEAREEGLEFEDDEKDAFARQFADAFEELNASVESIATAAVSLERDIDREDMIDLLYGKHSGLRKTDIREVFEAIDSLPEGGLSTEQTARLLRAFNSNLKQDPTVKVLEYVEEEANR